jgi:hypothetical protein
VSGVRKKKPDGFVKCLESLYSVIPAKAAIQYFQYDLDAGSGPA